MGPSRSRELHGLSVLAAVWVAASCAPAQDVRRIDDRDSFGNELNPWDVAVLEIAAPTPDVSLLFIDRSQNRVLFASPGGNQIGPFDSDQSSERPNVLLALDIAPGGEVLLLGGSQLVQGRGVSELFVISSVGAPAVSHLEVSVAPNEVVGVVDRTTGFVDLAVEGSTLFLLEGRRFGSAADGTISFEPGVFARVHRLSIGSGGIPDLNTLTTQSVTEPGVYHRIESVNGTAHLLRLGFVSPGQPVESTIESIALGGGAQTTLATVPGHADALASLGGDLFVAISGFVVPSSPRHLSSRIFRVTLGGLVEEVEFDDTARVQTVATVRGMATQTVSVAGAPVPSLVTASVNQDCGTPRTIPANPDVVTGGGGEPCLPTADPIPAGSQGWLARVVP